MKKRLSLLFLAFVFLAKGFSAYNPPVGREYLGLLGFPGLITGAASTVGGAIYTAGPHSIIFNPALTAPLQRVSVDAGFSGIFQEQGDSTVAGLAGILFPTRWGVLTGTLQAIFGTKESLSLGQAALFRGGFARDVTENLYLGASLYGGGSYGGSLNGWAVGADFGFVYRLGSLGFLRDARYSLVLADIGLPLMADVDRGFPGITTPKAGFAALFLSNKNMNAGFSADLSLPLWQNLLVDLGLQFSYTIGSMAITASSGWKLNVLETYKGYDVPLPFVGLSVKFVANTSGSQFLSSRGWQQTDIAVSGVWQRLYEGVHLVSAGASAAFGARDTEAPVIRLWEDGEGEGN